MTNENEPQNLALEQENEPAKELTIGEILAQKRQDLKIEIAEISSYLKVKKHDVLAIEEDRIDSITKHIYAPGLIKSYAKFLKIDAKLIEEKIKKLPIKSNIENKEHKLVNIGETTEITPTRDNFFNFLLISALLFLVLLSIYNSLENKESLITNQGIALELENLDK